MKKIYFILFLFLTKAGFSQSTLITPNSDGNGNFLFKSTGTYYGQFSTTGTAANLTFRVNEPAANNGSTGLITGAIYSDATRTLFAGYIAKAQFYGSSSVEIGTNNVNDRMVMTSTGRVGIGTNSPTSKLEVFNVGLNELKITSNFSPGVPPFNFIQFPSSRLSFVYEKGTVDEWRPGYIQSNDNGDFTGRLDFYTNGTGTGNKLGNIRAMSITKGNVGVGTTTPLTKMDVNGPIMTRDRLVFGNQNGNDPATNPVWVTDNYNNDFRLFQQPTLSGVGDVRMIVQNATGNVGIGTTPSVKFHMKYINPSYPGTGSGITPYGIAGFESNIDAFINLMTPSAYQSGVLFGSPLSSVRGGIIYNNDNGGVNESLALRTGGNLNRIIIDKNGNVGIGDFMPTYKLDIKGDLRMQGSDLVIGPVVGRGSGGRALVLEDNNVLNINYANDFTGGTLIDGNVGIGSLPNPSYKLSVNGTARTKEVIVETGWADYVFDEEYQLSSLSDVESYIKENKHLPDVPSAKEIQEKGASVGILLTKMMQKIEELTLYSIEQEKKIGQLQKDLVELQKRK